MSPLAPARVGDRKRNRAPARPAWIAAGSLGMLILWSWVLTSAIDHDSDGAFNPAAQVEAISSLRRAAAPARTFDPLRGRVVLPKTFGGEVPLPAEIAGNRDREISDAPSQQQNPEDLIDRDGIDKLIKRTHDEGKGVEGGLSRKMKSNLSGNTGGGFSGGLRGGQPLSSSLSQGTKNSRGRRGSGSAARRDGENSSKIVGRRGQTLRGRKRSQRGRNGRDNGASVGQAAEPAGNDLPIDSAGAPLGGGFPGGQGGAGERGVLRSGPNDNINPPPNPDLNSQGGKGDDTEPDDIVGENVTPYDDLLAHARSYAHRARYYERKARRAKNVPGWKFWVPYYRRMAHRYRRKADQAVAQAAKMKQQEQAEISNEEVDAIADGREPNVDELEIPENDAGEKVEEMQDADFEIDDSGGPVALGLDPTQPDAIPARNVTPSGLFDN